ncbi:nuclear transcription factor Y subunit C-3-like [Dorcoceras hygrometricum]|uniref:Nuclear transcription factor Y subunit C-3-like n=1 Tax=Dorcoceras hygrometricum TaxID=472368 RepID=A0A2Z7ABB3_9LAMI|nr:nuclear transcription factor Y subunit C-3-like [Dorcoceras hygrometricum]
MEHQGNELSPGTGVAGSSAQMAFGANSYQGNPMNITSSQVPIGATVPAQTAGFSPAPAQMGQQHLAYQQLHQQQQQQLQQQLQSFWATQFENLDHITDFKNHSLPLARIKKIMKADEDVRMISAEAPVVFARACELFILELTLRAWNHTEENKRRTLQRNDIAAAITRTDIFDFLIDIVPREDLTDEAVATMSAGTVPVGAPAEGLPYYYMPPPPSAPAVGTPGMIVGQPVDPSLYDQNPHAYMAQHMWPQEQSLPPADS